ncbi:hypothetical protein ACEPAF_2728 [Sanghuangporus sanghuang]
MNIYIFDAAAIVVALICIRSFLSWRKRRANSYPLPPGPKGLPIIGNVLDMPQENEWESVRQWGMKYGNITYIKKFGTGYLFLNSYEDAITLLEKRGGMYSSRPQITMLDLEGWSDWFTAVMPYGDKLRKARQLFNKTFQRSAAKDYYVVQIQSAHNLLLKLLEDPDKFRSHIRYAAAEAIIKIAYGYEITENDPDVEIIDNGIRTIVDAMAFHLVNALPVLRYIPSWFPGVYFHKKAKEGYKAAIIMCNEPHDRAKTKMADGTATPSMLSKLLEMYGHTDENESNEAFIAQSVAVAFGAGGDTIVSVLLTFILAMVLYPDAMRKGQEEVDRVVGKNNLPTFEDRPKLPYVEAICIECLRWQTVSPLGLAHLAEKDDVFKGYFIPAGTIVYGNVWAMLRDSKRYPEADKFIPDRWLPAYGEERPLESNKMAFGFGRRNIRICPGRFFAENSIYIGIASILAMFNIQKAINDCGIPIIPLEEYTSTLARHPKPFKCNITPRSEVAAAVVREAASSAK